MTKKRKKEEEMDNNTIEFEVSGRIALFTDPATKVGGEKCSMPVPTYEAIKGVLKSIYWKPSITWIPLEVRVMNPIRTESRGVTTLKDSHVHDISKYTYLKDVRYQVRAKFIFNTNRPEFKQDWISGKHYTIVNDMLKKGGRRDIFLGTRECQAYVKPCEFGSGEGAYDGMGQYRLGLMYHGITYADEAYDEKTEGRISINFWNAIMNDGVIRFPLPEECSEHKYLHKTRKKQFVLKGGD